MRASTKTPLRLMGIVALLGSVGALGQTFIVGMFAPDFQTQFGVTLTQIGTAYGLVVIVAGLAVPIIGPVAWRMGGPRLFVAWVLAGIVLSAFGLTAGLYGLVGLMLSLLGLRLFARHGVALAIELVTASASGRSRATLASLAAIMYPISLVTLPITIEWARETIGFAAIWYSIMIVTAVGACGAFVAAGYRRIRLRRRPEQVSAPVGAPLNAPNTTIRKQGLYTSSLVSVELTRSRLFIGLTGIYVTPLIIDTILVLYISTYSTNGLPLLAYAAGQMIGVGCARAWRLIGWSLRSALYTHLLPLGALVPLALWEAEIAPFVLLFSLGLSIGASNVLGVLAYAEAWRPELLPLLLSLRATISMMASAGAAILAAMVLETPYGWPLLVALIAVFLVATIWIFATAARVHPAFSCVKP